VSFWAIRNYSVHKKVVLSASVDAELFWRGNNPEATGASYKIDKQTVLSSNKELMAAIHRLDEIGQRDVFRREAMKFIKNDPYKFVKLYFNKLFYFWWFSPVSGILYPHHWLILYKVYYSIILLTAIMGLFHLATKDNSHRRKKAYLIMSFALAISIFQSFFYVEGRHRLGIEPIILIFSAAGAINFLKALMAGRK